MSSENVKEKVLDAMNRLPPNATIEDAIEQLYFLAKVEEGIRQADSGETVSHQEVKERFGK